MPMRRIMKRAARALYFRSFVSSLLRAFGGRDPRYSASHNAQRTFNNWPLDHHKVPAGRDPTRDQSFETAASRSRTSSGFAPALISAAPMPGGGALSKALWV